MRVDQMMTKAVVTVSPSQTLADAKRKMDEGGFRRVPVVEGNKLVGIISDRDLRSHQGALAHTKVNGVMTEDVVVVSPLATIESAARLMVGHRIGGIPVVEDDGTLAGIITATDLLAALADLAGGTDDDRVRIDVLLDGGIDRAWAAAELAATEGTRIFGLGTYESAQDGRTVFYMRIPKARVDAVARTLDQNGFKVLSIYP